MLALAPALDCFGWMNTKERLMLAVGLGLCPTSLIPSEALGVTVLDEELQFFMKAWCVARTYVHASIWFCDLHLLGCVRSIFFEICAS